MNRDPERFDPLFGRLPAWIREGIDRLSPLVQAEVLDAPVELVSGPRDKYFPVAESRALARRAANVRVTVTGAISHVDRAPAARTLLGLASLDGVAVRVLRAAAAGGEAHRGWMRGASS